MMSSWEIAASGLYDLAGHQPDGFGINLLWFLNTVRVYGQPLKNGATTILPEYLSPLLRCGDRIGIA
jgi:hypothetical protein